MAGVGYTYSKTNQILPGLGANSATDGGNGQDPNSLINREGPPRTIDRPHVVNAQASYLIPRAEIQVASNMTFASGYAHGATQNVSLPQGNTAIFIQNPGTYRTPFQKYVMLRFSRKFKLLSNQADLMAEIRNLLNETSDGALDVGGLWERQLRRAERMGVSTPAVFGRAVQLPVIARVSRRPVLFQVDKSGGQCQPIHRWTTDGGHMSKKLSRRAFAKKTVAAGAAVAAAPSVLLGAEAAPAAPLAAVSHVRRRAGAAAAVARRVRVPMPPDLDYGGLNLNGRDVTMLADTLTPAGQAKPNYPNGWVEGTTIPQEYYVDEKHYPNDEQFLKDHFWFMIDHHSRIPKPGDYFIYQYGRGDSIIVVRDKDNEVKAFHNVCRHRGSRLCISNELLPTERRRTASRPIANFSVVQLGPSGNTPVFRCPYHAWTYGTDGALTYLPAGGAGGLRSVAVRAAPGDAEGAGRVHLRHLLGQPAGFQHLGRAISLRRWRNTRRRT